MPVVVCTVLNSCWWTETPSETCRVSFQNKIDLIHWCIWLVLLYYTIFYYTCRNAQLYAHATLFLGVRTVQCLQPSACLLLHRIASHTDTTFQFPSHIDTTFQFPSHTRNSASVFIRLWHMDDKISWLGGWASQWRPPQM